MYPCKCHICYKDIDEQHYAIEHSGHGQMMQEKLLESYVTVWMHPECATIMMLRLAHDVMRIRNTPNQPRRVVDLLQDTVKRNKL
jgi:transcription antitermination factor NusG